MPINHAEIIEEMEGQIRKCGGMWSECCVGTAKDSRGPFFRRHLAADLGDGLSSREAYTTSAAQDVVAHLVINRGLQLDRDATTEAERRSGITQNADPSTGSGQALKVGATRALGALPAPDRHHTAFPRCAAWCLGLLGVLMT